MKQAIRLPLLLSVTTVFATACTPVPFEGQNNYTYGNNYTTPTPSYSAPTYSAPAPITSAPINNVLANTAPAPTRASIPEAGPLSAAAKAPVAPRPQTATTAHHSHANGNHAHPGNTQGHAHNTAANVPTAGTQQAAIAAPAANPTPIGTVPQVPAAGNVATVSYTPPAATNTSYTPPAAGGGSSYDTYAANTTSGNTASGSTYNTYAASSNSGSYNYGTDSNGGSSANTNSANTSYTSYGTGGSTGNSSSAGTNSYAANTSSTSGGSGSGNNYYAGANTSYDSYANTTASSNTSSSGTNSYAAASNTSAGGAAVQVFATVSREKAERIRQDIVSQGLPAIVDQADGLYKVRVPYSSASQARANLLKVRSVSGTPGAFVTAR